MSAYFEELDYRPTPIGPISLRRRRILTLDVDVFEIILGEEHLMSSLFTTSEIALAQQALAALTSDKLDVIVGGLGLGYTAQAVLEHSKVNSLIVVEMLEAVIDWHQEELVPLTPALNKDPRCRIIQGDFFAMAASKQGFNPKVPQQKFHAVLIDIDHSPDFLLDERSKAFYSTDGLARLAAHIHPGGVMALWSDAKPDHAFTAQLKTVFANACAEPVSFDNPLQQSQRVTQTIYLARTAN